MSLERPAESRRLMNVIAILAAMLLGAVVARAQSSIVYAVDYMFSRR
ncbi:MAG: hypothetical protein JWN07_2290 [Hyphomicrobiales bacterium]|nr:hypothetical protein [Hyphomicrobiales bacterium]